MEKSGKQFVFLVMAVLMVVLIVAFVILTFAFLLSRFESVLNQDSVIVPPLEFDIQGFERLNLLQ